MPYKTDIAYFRPVFQTLADLPLKQPIEVYIRLILIVSLSLSTDISLPPFFIFFLFPLILIMKRQNVPSEPSSRPLTDKRVSRTTFYISEDDVYSVADRRIILSIYITE